MVKMFNKCKSFIGLVLIAALLFGTGYYFGGHKYSEQHAATKDNFDLKLPGETERMVLTINEVEAKLQEIGELSSCEGDYTVRRGKDFTRYLIDKIPVPGTTNHVEIECNGVVKAGYKIDDVVPTIDEESKTIYIALPEIIITSNEILWDDNMQSYDTNTPLNPIDFEEYKTVISEIKEEGLQEAIKQGLYETAEANAHTVIRNFLGCFVDYKVKFI